MKRRSLLRCFATLPLAVWLSSCGRREEARFYVAGARYHPPATDLQSGETVEIVRTAYRGELAFEVRSRGRRIGYVPRASIGAVDRAHVDRARLVAVSFDRLPWRWYRVEVSMTGGDPR